MTPEGLIKELGIKSLYHFTDRKNLEGIAEHGLLSMEMLRSEGLVVPRPGGNDWSQEADMRRGLHRFVHLCFVKNHPMQFRAEQEQRIGPCSWLEVDPAVMATPDAWFTLEVSNKRDARLLRFRDWFEEADLEVLFATCDFRDPCIQERRQSAVKYEVLIPDRIALAMIKGL